MMMDITGSDPDRQFDCPVCMQQDSEPKLLPCPGRHQHSVCIDCIKTLAQHGKVNKAGYLIIQCPLCREHIILPPDGPESLPTNIGILQMRKVLDNANIVKICQFCDTNEKRSACIFCETCNKNLCYGCKEKHQTRKAFQGHKLVTITALLCSLHNDRMQYFCDDCYHYLCPVCVQNGSCDSHEVYTIKDITTKKKKEMESELEYIEKEISQITSEDFHPDVICKLLDSLDDQKIKLDEHVAYLHQKVNLAAANLSEKINSRRRDLLAILEYTEVAPKKLQQLEALRDIARECLRSGDDQVLLTLPSVHKDRIDLCCALTDMESSIFHLKFTPSLSLDVGSLEKNLEKYLKLWDKPILRSHSATPHCLLEVVFTEDLDIAIVGSHGSVLLVDLNGLVLAQTEKSGWDLKPFGIAYHSKHKALVVTNKMSSKITYMDPKTLDFFQHVTASKLSHPHGIAVLSSGNLVVTQCVPKDEVKIAVLYDTGEMVRSWKTYGQSAKTLERPIHVRVDRNDLIWISEGKDTLLAFNTEGHLVNEIKTPIAPYGLGFQGSDIFVAISLGLRAALDNGRVVVCSGNSENNNYKTVIKWTEQDICQLGLVTSVTIQQRHLAVLGHTGLRLYYIL